METKKFNPIWILIVLVVGFFAFNLMRSPTTPGKATDSLQQPEQIEPTKQTTETTETTPTPTPSSNKEFTISGKPFSYDVKEIKVNKGDTVKIIFKNLEGMHDWKLDEFNANTKVIGTGESETITFVADKTGTFEYYCSVGQHRANGMKGNLIVE